MFAHELNKNGKRRGFKDNNNNTTKSSNPSFDKVN